MIQRCLQVLCCSIKSVLLLRRHLFIYLGSCKSVGLHFCRWYYASTSSFKFSWRAPKDARLTSRSAHWPFKVIRGRWFSAWLMRVDFYQWKPVIDSVMQRQFWAGDSYIALYSRVVSINLASSNRYRVGKCSVRQRRILNGVYMKRRFLAGLLAHTPFTRWSWLDELALRALVVRSSSTRRAGSSSARRASS